MKELRLFIAHLGRYQYFDKYPIELIYWCDTHGECKQSHLQPMNNSLKAPIGLYKAENGVAYHYCYYCYLKKDRDKRGFLPNETKSRRKPAIPDRLKRIYACPYHFRGPDYIDLKHHQCAECDNDLKKRFERERELLRQEFLRNELREIDEEMRMFVGGLRLLKNKVKEIRNDYIKKGK